MQLAVLDCSFKLQTAHFRSTWHLSLQSFVRTVRVMLSSGGVSLTDLQEPTHTVTAAVKTMFKLAGTVITAGATATTARHR